MVLTDTPDDGLAIAIDTIKVDLGTELPPDTYQITQKGAGFSLSFSPKDLRGHIGEQLVVTYQMNLKDTQPTVSYFENHATLWLNDDPILKAKTGIYTGGKHFIKTDAIDQHPLKGATFLVKNQAGEYLAQTDHGYQWGSRQTAAAQTKFVTLISDADGLFSINGLTYGTYYLEEESAPAGYTPNKAAIGFEIAKGTYEASDQVLTVVNKKTTQPGKQTPSDKLPQTNDNTDRRLMYVGIVLVLIIGSIQISRKEKE